MTNKTKDSGASALDDLKAALDNLLLIKADWKRASERIMDIFHNSKLSLDFIELTREQWKALDSVLIRMRREEFKQASDGKGKS